MTQQYQPDLQAQFYGTAHLSIHQIVCSIPGLSDEMIEEALNCTYKDTLDYSVIQYAYRASRVAMNRLARIRMQFSKTQRS
jgi:hypothetical protein